MEEEKKSSLIFPEGISFFKPRENAPPTIKGNIVIELPELLEFAKSQNIMKTLRIDLRKSERTGGLYLTLNTWKPTKPESVGEVKPEDIPF